MFSYFGALLYAQEYNYIHYTNKEGLAGNTVYGVTQDKDGYLFFATENGLSRYDGKEWVTFTVDDGLSDNEVLKMFVDSKDRVWLFPFTKSICYYYKGKIYNNTNDSLLKKINLNGIIHYAFEDADKNIIFSSLYEAVMITAKNEVNYFTRKLYGNTVKIISDARAIENTNCFFITINDTLFKVCNGTLLPLVKPQQTIRNFHPVIISLDKGIPHLNFIKFNEHQITAINYVSGVPFFINTTKGLHILDTVKNEYVNPILQNKRCVYSFVDAEKNLWVCTEFSGVYKISSLSFKTYSTYSGKPDAKQILAINSYNNKIVAANTDYLVQQISKKGFIETIKLPRKYGTSAATKILKINNNAILIGYAGFMAYLTNSKCHYYDEFGSTKSITKLDSNSILVATGDRTVKASLKKLDSCEVIFSERSTYAVAFNNDYYIGTTSGLYKVDFNKNKTYLGNLTPALTRRITNIQAYKNSSLIIATADNGIVILKNNKVFKTITKANGLINNNCKTLFLNGDYLWVGTVAGINKIDLTGKDAIIKYSSSDGLPSDIVNAIYVDDDSTIWVGSPEGLTSFKENQIRSTSICNIVMQRITVSNKDLLLDRYEYILKYKDNNIQFQFVGISFRSGDEITYSYKLNGLNDDWKTTQERILTYPSLLPGKYTLQLFATNKFGVKSKTIVYHFTIETPFWKTIWFWVIAIIVSFTILFLIIYWRYKRLQARNAEKNELKIQLANMEQQALQAQMNPHFIFNCLNSIQQLILAKETIKANNYLLHFSKLIRSTLDNSDKRFITLGTEINYLQHYLILEELRFSNSFDYEITVANDIEINNIYIPAMLLQPFIENSLRHGIRQLENKKGTVAIEFTQRNGYLICHIKDNGIGRAASEKYKSNMHIEYQSKGMSLTAKRVTLLNTNTEHKITIEIIDLVAENNIATGTEVVVKIPIS